LATLSELNDIVGTLHCYPSVNEMNDKSLKNDFIKELINFAKKRHK